jgi:INO80 complex subunit C
MSYWNAPRPFKNPHYTKNVNRRTKNLKAVLAQERERERLEREKRKEERMQVDGDAPVDPEEEDMPTCQQIPNF